MRLIQCGRHGGAFAGLECQFYFILKSRIHSNREYSLVCQANKCILKDIKSNYLIKLMFFNHSNLSILYFTTSHRLKSENIPLTTYVPPLYLIKYCKLINMGLL